MGGAGSRRLRRLIGDVPRLLLLVLLASGLFAPAAHGQERARPFPDAPGDARIVAEDLVRFWDAWDAMQAEKSREARERELRARYLEPGSPGLEEFHRLRIGSAWNLLDAISTAPEYYASLRALTPRAAAIAEPVREAYARLEALYPPAVFPDVYLLMGALNSAGTLGETGLLIGVEMHGRRDGVSLAELNDWLWDVLRPPEALPYIIAHELIHFQQDLPEQPTLLEAVIVEGSADFLAELIAGDHINRHIHEWALPREKAIWKHLEARAGSSDYSDFLYGGAGEGRPEGWPADVGYFVGYRIARAYYERADDKKQAIADILTCTDFAALLAASGYAERFRE